MKNKKKKNTIKFFVFSLFFCNYLPTLKAPKKKILFCLTKEKWGGDSLNNSKLRRIIYLQEPEKCPDS